MTHTSRSGRRPWRILVLAIALLTLGLLAGALEQPSFGQKPEGGSSATKEMVQLINAKIEEGWKANKLEPSAPCTDHEYIRRVSLDVIGRIATPEEIAQFLKDPKDTRRELLVERLLKSDEYPRNWANLWANWLLSRTGVFGRGGKGTDGKPSYHEQLEFWLEDQFSQNKPHNEIVKKLISARGKNSETDDKNDGGAVNFILAHVGESTRMGRNGGDKTAEEGAFDMVPLTSRITRLFLGIQTQCTQCHDHPFDGKLKQKHFWGVNTFLRQVERVGTPPMMQNGNRGMVVYPMLELRDNTDYNRNGKLFFEKRNGVVLQTAAVFLDDSKPEAGTSRRDELARMVIEHEQFPRAYANRMWAHFFGRGIVNPIDDFNDQNVPSHPELLNELAKKIKHYNYNQKDLIRWITASRPYQLSSVTNKTNEKSDTEQFFSRQILKTMSPEQIFESLMTATQAEAAKTKEGAQKLRQDWMDKLVANFGDDEGNEVSFNGTVVQALLMMNGKDINDAIAPGEKDKGVVAGVFNKNRGNERLIINDLYLATLNRPATPAEMNRIHAAFVAVPIKETNLQARYQDLMWALVNSNEFMLNH